MKKILLGINLIGVATVTILETVRPGIVSGAMSISWIWLGTLLLSIPLLRLPNADAPKK